MVRVILAGLLLAALAVAVACGGGDDDDDAGAGEPASGGEADLEITATDNEFSEDALNAPANTEVTLRLNNEGSALHNWVVPDEDIEMDLVDGGESAEVSFSLPAGEYEYVCEVHPQEMAGTLIVE